MCKRMFFLIFFVLVLSLAGSVVAEDLMVPYWAGAPGSVYILEEFNEEAPWFGPAAWANMPEDQLMVPHPEGYEIDPDRFEWIWEENENVVEALGEYVSPVWGMNNWITTDGVWHEEYAGRDGVLETPGFGFMMSNFDGEGTKHIWIQMVTRGPALEGAEVEGDGWFEEMELELISEIDLGDGWFHYTYLLELDFNPGWEAFSFFTGFDENLTYIDQLVVDTICFLGEDPNDGPGRGGPGNPNPGNGEERVDPDGLLLTWTPDPCSKWEDIYFSSNFDDVNDACAAAYQPPTQADDVNYWPTVGDLGDDVNLNEWYYWRIDENNSPGTWDARGPVWSFKVKGPNSAEPSPEDEAYAGPCVILTWDAGAWAEEHYVYLDVNEANVIGRVGPCDVITEPNEESYDPPGMLGWDETYYWAVDENDVCDVVTPGEVWSFTVPRDPCDGPEWRYEDDTLYAIWGFNYWDTGPNVAADYNSYPVGFHTFEPNCINGPNQVLASYDGRDHVADNNGPEGGGAIRLKHTDNALPGQNVKIRAGLIWSGENPPTNVVLERLSGWGPGPDPCDGWSVQDNAETDLETLEALFEIELCDGWMYSVYEVEFKLTDPADNIHVVIESSGGAFYLDSVFVDAQWYTPPEAHGPSPADGAVGVLLDTCKLTWYPGAEVKDHNVYFSESWAEVNDACATALVGDRQDSNFYPEGADCLADVGKELKPGVTYYWRVNEVNDPCLWEGAVWSFTAIPYMVIDDFNHYDIDPNMAGTWIDHTTQPTWGSYVKRSTNAEPNTSPPYSMKFEYYWKSTQPHIFTRRTFDPPQDWTKGGLAALVLWFYGDANSTNWGYSDRITSTEMYVTLTDDQGNVWKEYYDGEANDLIANEWMEWNLALSDFNGSPNNVDTTNIESIDIGVSGMVMSAEKLFGRIWFDDIRLYVPRCVSMYAVDISSDPEGDFAGAPDCIVDGWDLDAMFTDWVVGDMNVLSVDVCDANLLVEYTFDPCAAYDDLGNPWDSSGNNYHGIGISEPNVHVGILTLSGSNSVEIGGDFNDINPFRGAIKGGGDFTIAMKFRTEELSVLFSSCPYDPCVTEPPNDTDPSNNAMVVFLMGEDDPAVTYDNWYIAAASVTDSPTDNQWHFMVVTHDADGGITGEDPPGDEPEGVATGLTTVYLDGVPGEANPFDPNLVDPCSHSIRIGTTRHAIMPYAEGEDIVDMTGDIDEVRVYDRVLLHGEIVNLMGVPAGEWLYFPVDSDADLYEDEPAATSLESTRFVNFKDYTYMMQYWLVWQPFPPED